MAGLSGQFGIQHVPQTVPGQQLGGVGVGVEGDVILLGEHAQLLGHHAAAPQVDLVKTAAGVLVTGRQLPGC